MSQDFTDPRQHPELERRLNRCTNGNEIQWVCQEYLREVAEGRIQPVSTEPSDPNSVFRKVVTLNDGNTVTLQGTVGQIDFQETQFRLSGLLF